MGKYYNNLLFIFLAFLYIHAAHGQSTPNFALAGFATETTGTTGGQTGDTLTVTTGLDLQNAIKNHQDSNDPLIIMVEGVINLENSTGLEKIDVKDVIDLSIIGSVNGAEFSGIGLKMSRVSNVIIRNIKFHHVLSGEKDCMGVEGPADHIWIDHCEFYNEFGDVDGDGDEDSSDKDFYDGLLDIKRDAEYITCSWNYFHDSWKTSLVGSSESDTYDRKLTLHHNYYENCYSRLPLFRGGTGHVFNCYYHNIESTAINTRIGACIRIEKNYFENVLNPWVSAYSDVLGGAELIDNELINSPFDHSRDDVSEPEVCSADIPYFYNSVLSPVSEVKTMVMQYAGVGKLAHPASFETAGNETSVVGRKALQLTQVKTHPNPVKNSLTISFSLNTPSMVSMAIYDALGKVAMPKKEGTYPSGVNKMQVNTEHLNKGVFIIKIKCGKNCVPVKFIKQ